MDTNRILADLRAERDRVNQAISALESLGATGSSVPRRGRPPGAARKSASAPSRGRRHMSAAARKRISEMMKQRWVERRKKGKSA